jgi:hypothetical protein
MAGSLPSLASSAAPIARDGVANSSSFRERLLKVEAELTAQTEARNRQADAFDAATTRIEMVNSLLVAVIALAGIGGSLLAIRWVRSLAQDQVADQVAKAVDDIGHKTFEAKADVLSVEYDRKFADLYREYHKLVKAK